MKRSLAAVALCTSALALAGCSDDDPIRSGSMGSADDPATPSETAEPVEPPTDAPTGDLDVALSEPREDSLYPEVGDPGVDALHYDLALGWSPDTDTLEATETLTFRSTETDGSFQLDFSEVLEIDLLTV